MRTFGVEEELCLVDAETGIPVALADLVARPESGDDNAAGDHDAGPASVSVGLGVRDAPVRDVPVRDAGHVADRDVENVVDDRPVHELQREQVETDTRPCASLDDLVAQLVERRAAAGQAAHRIGAEVAALGTSPLPIKPSVTLDERYVRMTELYAMTAQEQLTCGCHVHISIDSEEEGVAVLDRIRPWLPPLLALTANSPSTWPSGGPAVPAWGKTWCTR